MKHTLIFLLIVFVASPSSAQWHTASDNAKILAFCVHDTSLFVSEWDQVANVYGISRYIPTGAPFENWVEADGGVAGNKITSFASLGNYFFAGVTGGDSYRSNDGGANWTLIANGPICTNGTYLFCDGIYRSRDSGNDWLHGTFDQVANLSVYAFAAIGSCIFASTTNGLWRSLDSGSDTSWHQVTTPITNVACFAVVGTTIYGANQELMQSTDSGADWALVATPGFTVTSLATDSQHLFAGGPNGLYLLNRDGSWTREDSSVEGTGVVSLGVFDTLLFADFSFSGNIPYELYYRSISEMLDTTKSAVVLGPPANDTLSIYPNPSQGIVLVQSGASLIEHVSLLDVLGREVFASSPRSSEISLDLSKLPAGTYFLQVTGAQGTEVRKVVRE
jgi:Secretion system C-terminal sorting domain